MEQLKLFDEELKVGSKVRILGKSVGAHKLPWRYVSRIGGVAGYWNKGDVAYIGAICKNDKVKFYHLSVTKGGPVTTGGFGKKDLRVIY